MIWLFSSSATTDGTRFRPSSPGITTGVSPCMNATREFVVPRSIPTMRSADIFELTGLPFRRLRRLRLSSLGWRVQTHWFPRVDRRSSADHALNERLEEHVRMDRSQGTSLIEAPADLGGNRKFDRAQIVFELGQLAGTDDGRRNARLSGDPVESNQGRRAAHFLGDFEKYVEDSPILRIESHQRWIARVFRLFEAAIAAPIFALTFVFASQETAGERAPRTDAEAKFLRQRDMLALNVAFHQRVFELQGDWTFFAFLLGQRVGTSHVPGGGVGETVVANLAFAHQVVQSGHNFFDRGHRVPRMQPVQVDVVVTQTAQ